MKENRDIYKSEYGFAKEQHAKRVKYLKIVAIAFPLIIVSISCYGFFNSLDYFSKKEERTGRVFTDPTPIINRNDEFAEVIESYQEVNIPYEDPQGRFSIQYMSFFPNGEIAVVIRTQKDYDKVKAEADAIVKNARESVEITSITYLNQFE